MNTTKYIALGNDNKPLLNGKQKTLQQWQRYGAKLNKLKKYGFVCIVGIIPNSVSGRDYEYVRINYAHK